MNRGLWPVCIGFRGVWIDERCLEGGCRLDA